MIDTLDFMELLSLSPREALAKIVTHSNQVDIPPEHLDFGTPEVVEGRVTKIKVTGRRPYDLFTGQLYVGSIDFTFKRINFGELFSQTKLSVQLDLPCKTYDLIRVLSNHYGYVFDSGDYINEIITAENAYQYVLKAAPYSLRWCGEVQIPLLKKVSLETVSTVKDFGRLVTPDNKIYPHQNKHFTDGRFYGDYLKRLVLGEVPVDNILPKLLERLYYQVGQTPPNWTYSNTPTTANLKGAKVTFNGRALDCGVVPYVFTVSRVLQIELDEGLNTSIRGPLTINYNAQVVDLVPDYPTVGYRYPAELWAGVLDGSPELRHFETFYEDTVFTQMVDTTFMDRIMGLPTGTVKCRPTPALINLYNAKVEYLGRNVSYWPSHNSFLTLIWVIRLDPAYSTYLGGRLMIYYRR